MKAPAIAPDEKERLKILDDLGIVYSPAEERFDRITRLARRIFDVPIALVSLITSNTQWFKSSQGLTVCETSREVSFCGHAILGDDVFVIPDALKDPDFADNPIVVNEPHVRFYAGQPVKLNSVKLGTLCIIDHRPRRFQQADFDTLKSLALWIENELKLSLYTASQKELMARVGTLQRKMLIDSVTGCWNKRGLDKLINNEISRAHRQEDPVSLIKVDMESTIAGTRKPFPTATVDVILKEVAQQIRSSIRSHDIVGKIGKYQFLVCMINCNKRTCKVLTKRILRNIAITRIKLNGENIRLSAHIGSTSNKGTDIWSSTLLAETASKALQQARDENTTNDFVFLIPKIGA
jgi:diguanylate cyclase (GGDEF)-like protein